MCQLYIYSPQEEQKLLANLFVYFLLQHDFRLITTIYWDLTFTRQRAKHLTNSTLFPLFLTRALWNRYHLTDEVYGPKEVNCLPQGHMEAIGNADIWMGASDFRAATWTANLRQKCLQLPSQPSTMNFSQEAVAFLFYKIVLSLLHPNFYMIKQNLFYSWICLHCLAPSTLFLKHFPLILAFLPIKSGENQYFTEERRDHKVHWWGPRNRSTNSMYLPP